MFGIMFDSVLNSSVPNLWMVKDPRSPSEKRPLHDLVLGQATVRIGIHAVAATRCDVLDEAQAEGTSTVRIALELGDGRVCRFGGVEADNTAAS